MAPAQRDLQTGVGDTRELADDGRREKRRKAAGKGYDMRGEKERK